MAGPHPIHIRSLDCLMLPIACRHIIPCLLLFDANNVRERIVRGEGVGISRGPGKRMCVRITPPGAICAIFHGYHFFYGAPRTNTRSSRFRANYVNRNRMPMECQLLLRERGLADSAGNIRPPPSTPRLSPLRRGSHNVRHSTVAGCWRLQI